MTNFMFLLDMYVLQLSKLIPLRSTNNIFIILSLPYVLLSYFLWEERPTQTTKDILSLIMIGITKVSSRIIKGRYFKGVSK